LELQNRGAAASTTLVRQWPKDTSFMAIVMTSLFAIALKKPRAVANKKSPSHLSMGDDTHCEG
jgi:hypothetical protein